MLKFVQSMAFLCASVILASAASAAPGVTNYAQFSSIEKIQMMQIGVGKDAAVVLQVHGRASQVQTFGANGERPIRWVSVRDGQMVEQCLKLAMYAKSNSSARLQFAFSLEKLQGVGSPLPSAPVTESYVDDVYSCELSFESGGSSGQDR